MFPEFPFASPRATYIGEDEHHESWDGQHWRWEWTGAKQAPTLTARRCDMPGCETFTTEEPQLGQMFGKSGLYRICTRCRVGHLTMRLDAEEILRRRMEMPIIRDRSGVVTYAGRYA